MSRHPPTSSYLDCKRTRASGDIARHLAVRPSDPVVYLRRLLSFEGAPVVLDEIWLPGNLFKKLTAERLAEYTGPLYGLFETEFGTRMIRADERIRAVAATADAAKHLKVASGSPLLLVERVSYTYGERPVEVRRGLSVTERYHYRNTSELNLARADLVQCSNSVRILVAKLSTNLTAIDEQLHRRKTATAAISQP